MINIYTLLPRFLFPSSCSGERGRSPQLTEASGKFRRSLEAAVGGRHSLGGIQVMAPFRGPAAPHSRVTVGDRARLSSWVPRDHQLLRQKKPVRCPLALCFSGRRGNGRVVPCTMLALWGKDFYGPMSPSGRSGGRRLQDGSSAPGEGEGVAAGAGRLQADPGGSAVQGDGGQGGRWGPWALSPLSPKPCKKTKTFLKHL